LTLPIGDNKLNVDPEIKLSLLHKQLIYSNIFENSKRYIAYFVLGFSILFNLGLLFVTTKVFLNELNN
jgi:hypothetical protein